MLEKLSESSGPAVGYKVVGKVTAVDYQQLNPEIQALVDEYDDNVCLLLDLQEFAGEEAKAWLSELDTFDFWFNIVTPWSVSVRK